MESNRKLHPNDPKFPQIIASLLKVMVEGVGGATFQDCTRAAHLAAHLGVAGKHPYEKVVGRLREVMAEEGYESGGGRLVDLCNVLECCAVGGYHG